MKRWKARIVALTLGILFLVLAWEIAYDINDPTIPLVRELIFTIGSLTGFVAFLFVLLEED